MIQTITQASTYSLPENLMKDEIMLKNLEQSAEAIADSADRLSQSSKSFFKLMLVFIIGGPLLLIGYIGYTNRDNIAPAIYKMATTNRAPILVTEWDLISRDKFPEFYRCSDSVCIADYSKRHLVEVELNKLLRASGANRAIFYVYGQQYEQIALQVTAPGHQSYSSEFWHVPVIGNLQTRLADPHSRGQCAYWQVDVNVGPYLGLKANRYSIVESRSCPLESENATIAGYLSLDFGSPLSNEEAEKIEAKLKKSALSVQDIMGFSMPLATQKTIVVGSK